MLRGEPGQRPGGQQARVAERLVHAGGVGRERLRAARGVHRQLVVLGADRLGHRTRVSRFVVAAVRQAEAEGGERMPEGPRGEGRHQPRVHAAREEDAEGHLARHARGDRTRQRLARGGRRVGGAQRCHTLAGGANDRVPRPPVARAPLQPLAEDERVGRRHLAQGGEGAVLAGEEAVGQIAGERGRGGLARHPRQHGERPRGSVAMNSGFSPARSRASVRRRARWSHTAAANMPSTRTGKRSPSSSSRWGMTAVSGPSSTSCPRPRSA